MRELLQKISIFRESRSGAGPGKRTGFSLPTNLISPRLILCSDYAMNGFSDLQGLPDVASGHTPFFEVASTTLYRMG
jgi:hypothetical protein